MNHSMRRILEVGVFGGSEESMPSLKGAVLKGDHSVGAPLRGSRGAALARGPGGVCESFHIVAVFLVTFFLCDMTMKVC